MTLYTDQPIKPPPRPQKAHSLSVLHDCRFEVGGKHYDGRVCFKVLIKPGYHMSGKTIATRDGEEIDKQFKDSELEWSTNIDRGIYLYGLMIQVDGPHPPQ